MFAVPGWAVSAANLKAETAAGSKDAGSGAGGGDHQEIPAKANADKKRKRPSVPTVTSSNVADLWERVIEGKQPPQQPVKKARTDASRPKNKKNPGGNQNVGGSRDEAVKGVSSEEKAVTPAKVADVDAKEKRKKKRKEKKQKSKEGRHDEGEEGGNDVEVEGKEEPTKLVSAPPPPAPKLTPLQASMREKLISARFRHLNETLYTKPSTDAFKLFEESPEMFQEYHEGFRRQVNVWPENPVDGYLEDIRSRGRQRAPHKDKGAAYRPGTVAPLLRTNGLCTIADLGCGDAKLAEALQSDKKKLKLDILSYDLQSPSPLVTKADIANLPLADGSVNVVIFCLALMGTNWLDFVEEAYRILHWKGELWVAEIKSRFAPPSSRKGPVTHSVGNRKRQPPAKKSKEKDGELEQSNQIELGIEVDGEDDRRGETDVSAFVEALRKRGFILQGEADLSNRMFVKMHFVKAAPALVGKGAVAAKDTNHGGKKKNAARFVEEDNGKLDENSILKPCVYKIR